MKRCKWCNLNNPLYIEYHDKEWGIPNFDDKYLFEMLLLESFQAGLSWECILNKRKYFKKAYENFDIDKIINFDERKIKELLSNDKIIRNKLKINASINNAKIFKNIQNEYGSFYKYLLTFTKNKILKENDKRFIRFYFKRFNKKRYEICRINNYLFIFTSHWLYILT